MSIEIMFETADVRCQDCNKKFAELENGCWLVVKYKGLGVRVFANGAAMLTCPHCGKETGIRLTTGGESGIKQFSIV